MRDYATCGMKLLQAHASVVGEKHTTTANARRPTMA